MGGCGKFSTRDWLDYQKQMTTRTMLLSTHTLLFYLCMPELSRIALALLPAALQGLHASHRENFLQNFHPLQLFHNPPSIIFFNPDDSKLPFKYRAEREYPPILDGEQLALPQDGMFCWWSRLHYGLTSLAWRPLLLPPPQLQRDINSNAALRMSRSLRREFGHFWWNLCEPKWCT